MSLSDVEVAMAAATAGAETVRSTYGSDPVRHIKTGLDFATDTDLESEQAIMAVLARHRPADERTGEESGSSGGAANGRRWLVDPLCGTLNFAATTPLFAVNVALVDSGRVIAAAVADPMTKELFWTDGGPAMLTWSDGEPSALKPRRDSALVDINCDGPTDRAFVGGQLVSDPRLRAAYGPRVLSTTLALAWVAAGRRAAYISDGWLEDSVHFAAGIALCAAAGCVVSDLAGGRLHHGRGLIAAADAETHAAILELVRPHLAAVVGRPSHRTEP